MRERSKYFSSFITVVTLATFILIMSCGGGGSGAGDDKDGACDSSTQNCSQNQDPDDKPENQGPGNVVEGSGNSEFFYIPDYIFSSLSEDLQSALRGLPEDVQARACTESSGCGTTSYLCCGYLCMMGDFVTEEDCNKVKTVIDNGDLPEETIGGMCNDFGSCDDGYVCFVGICFSEEFAAEMGGDQPEEPGEPGEPDECPEGDDCGSYPGDPPVE